jgi:hypothetical protein
MAVPPLMPFFAALFYVTGRMGGNAAFRKRSDANGCLRGA